MKIVLNAEHDLTLTDLDGPGLEVEEAEDAHVHFSALEMFHASLAFCTASVLAAYGENIGAPTSDVEIRVRWDYVEDPYRVGRIDMDVVWPGLPESRLKAAKRVAGTCTIHNTLHHPPRVETRVSLGRPGDGGA